MAGLPTALRLLACWGDHGLLGMREKTSVRVVCGLWFRWPQLGFTGIWRFREAQTPLSAERQTGIHVCQPFAESSMPSLGLSQGGWFLLAELKR